MTTRPRRPKGRGALKEYAETPVSFTPLESEPLLRLLICDLVGEDVTRESMATLRDDIADVQARLDDAERTARDLAHREKYLLMVSEFRRKYLDLPLQLIDQVGCELTGDRESSGATARTELGARKVSSSRDGLARVLLRTIYNTMTPTTREPPAPALALT